MFGGVCAQVFEGCILRGPLSSKARLLVTNQLQFLPYVDKVIVMGAEEGGACRLLDQVTTNSQKTQRDTETVRESDRLSSCRGEPTRPPGSG